MKIKKPNALLYFLTYIFVVPFLKFCYSYEIDNRGLVMPKGSCIVVSNHTTYLDFLFSMLSLYPKRLNAITAHKYFYHSPLHWLLPLMGCIPKNMFDPDVRSVIGIKQVLKRGGAVLLFPEGRCSIGNAFSAIHKSTGKLLKKLGVPVIGSYIEGTTVCLPLWRKGSRYGRVRVTNRVLFSADDLKKMSADEINAAITARLSGADVAKMTKKPHRPVETRQARRLAEGLHMLLYYCHQCGSEFFMMTEKNTIRCSSCGYTAIMDKCGKLHIDKSGECIDISDWYEKQMCHEMESLRDDMEPIVFNVKVKLPSSKPGGGMVHSGFGTMRIDPKGWHFDGELDGAQTNLFFPVDAVPAITFDFEKDIQISYDGKYYIFIPEDLRKCVKYTIIAECLHRKFAKHLLMT